MKTLFHLTSADAARAILSSGFKDGAGFYITDQEHTGVWFSNVPDDLHTGVLLTVDFTLTYLGLREIAFFHSFIVN